MAAGANWSLEETRMAFMLYLLLPSNEISKTGADVMALAERLERTPSSVAMKIYNISAHDENRLAQGRVGLPNGSKLDAQIWDLYEADREAFLDEGIQLLRTALARTPTSQSLAPIKDSFPMGKERLAEVRQRVNQRYFKNTLMVNYGRRCCLTGIDAEPLLIASHIKPWAKSDPATEQLAPSNGLLLNALHDAAFDRGLITIGFDLCVVLSRELRRRRDREPEAYRWLCSFEGKRIATPSAHPPAREFIEYHQDAIFRG